MLTAKKIKCRPRSVGQRNWAAQFERWLGYPLHRDARRAISLLERQRAQKKPQRLYLCDADAEKEALKQALVNYVRWLATVVRPGAPFCIVGKNRKQLDRLLPRRSRKALPDPKWQPILSTARSPEYCRGLSFPMALILDGDAYPRRGRHLSRVWRSVIPCLSMSEESLLVVHGTYRPKTRVNVFTNEIRRPSRPWPNLDLAQPPDPPPEEELIEREVLLGIPPDLSILNQIYFPEPEDCPAVPLF